MTTPHPHADLLRAIADGRQMQIKRPSEWRDCDASTALAGLASVAPHHIRIKPDTVTINGIECPAPMRVEPEMGSWYYAPTPTNEAKFTLWAWSNDATDQRFFAEGLCFATAADAAAVAKAMLAPLKLKGGEE